MMFFRFFSGMPHGAFFGIGAVVSGYLTRPEKAAQAMAIMFSGLTIANILGVPLGTYIGQQFHWSFSFLLVGVAGLATLASIKKSTRLNSSHVKISYAVFCLKKKKSAKMGS